MAATTNFTTVTEEQIDRCTRVIDMQTGEPFYMVLSESDELTTYKVQYHKDPKRPGKGYFTCTCPAGQEGFIHCSSLSCKHVRWSIAAARVYKANMKAQAQAQAKQREHLLIVDGKEVDEETYNRVMNAKPYAWTEEEIQHDFKRYQARPFSLMK
ncbi:hypothetical protein KSC_081790 [Ktedonobacter sp. SOSP1-52]|uniref:hypothetical protein n=1 Tax=Ktedonobacter sp. SOSP1-52 TaxID=2778366 RepID=UPI0019166BD9|nr:hypothetical protein [Ktedonobacter sp. SOSP1-52]GHO69287.1 hypothetical protein KSC_081790 [Ktedonobacter sp. SOSP1-52]